MRCSPRRPCGPLLALCLAGLCLTGLAACTNGTASRPASSGEPAAPGQECLLVEDGFGPAGEAAVEAEVVADGLEVPWGVAFLPNGDLLVTERPGRLRLVRGGELLEEPVATVEAAASGEGGLLGLALHPDFAENRFFYLYYTTEAGGAPVNRVERWTLAEDGLSAAADQVLLDDIPAATYHNGGPLRFGPDGMLYVGTGDAREPQNSQDPASLAGKILRLTPDGDVPEDNPFPGSPVFITGIRNTQGFAWPNDSTLWVTDHGPSGELGRTGHDEVSVARAGDNLGWPTIYGCRTAEGLVTPALSWSEAAPPGGAAVYTGTAIPEWEGGLLVGTLGSRHLHHVALDRATGQVERHGVYFRGNPPEGLGRLRAVTVGPDGALYVTTSNCDGRGTCPPEGDQILRIVPE